MTGGTNPIQTKLPVAHCRSQCCDLGAEKASQCGRIAWGWGGGGRTD